MLLSVIIPFHEYNGLLKRTIDSIRTQLNAESELILIGDGIPEYICANIEQEYPVLKVFSIQKSGANKAREVGIKKASGLYVLLVDSDDVLVPHALELYSTIILNHHPDLIIANVERIVKQSTKGAFYNFSNTEQLIPKSNLNKIQLYTFPVLICKCIKKSCVEDLSFDSSSMYQDFNITAKIFSRIDTLYYTNTITYQYYIREQSTNTFLDTREKIRQAMPAIKGILEHYKKYKLSTIDSLYFRMVCIRFYFTLIKRTIPLCDFKFSNEIRMQYLENTSLQTHSQIRLAPKAFIMSIILCHKIVFSIYYVYNRILQIKK